MPTLRELLIQAVEDKKPFRTVYQGHERFLCAHGIGYKNRKDGDRVLQVIAYQFDGDSSKGRVKFGGNHKENWRCMSVDQISGVDFVDDGAWYSSDNHSRPSTYIDEYIAQTKE